MSYRYLDHGADIGIEAKDETLEGVFIDSARAVFGLMTDVEEITTDQSIKIELKESELEDLFYEWLSELISLGNMNRQVYGKFEGLTIEKAEEEYRLEATALGERIDPEKHELGTEVKALTYLGLELSQVDGGWKGRFVLDV